MDHGSIVLSFDVEEHHRIEAAVGYDCPKPRQAEYADRMEVMTRRLLDLLAESDARATFFIVGQIALKFPKLIRDIDEAGHEVACHSWSHQRVHRFTPASFAEDLRKSKEILEQASGHEVRGFRAPTFSIVRQTAWAIDVLVDEGFTYDSSIFPVRHDRYGIPDAPRSPFYARGVRNSLLELPPVTLRCMFFNVPVAGGGYFRLFPLGLLKAGVRQVLKLSPASAMLYFHPWEFDVDQPRLPLTRLSRFRTYVGIGGSFDRLRSLLSSHHDFRRAIDVADGLSSHALPEFSLFEPASTPTQAPVIQAMQ